MPRSYPSRKIIKTLKKKSFSFVSQKGSHAKFRKSDLTVIVPIHNKDIPYGTFKSILRQSQLEESDFQ